MTALLEKAPLLLLFSAEQSFFVILFSFPSYQI
jgi:hypothetical protein